MPIAFDLARAVREALSYDTRTRAGSRALVSYLMDLLDYGEFQIVEQATANSGSDSTNLVGLRGPPGPGGLLLSSAVLPPADVDAALWVENEEDPLNATERDGLLIGLGAAGNRLDLVARVLAAGQVPAERLRRPLVLAGLFGDDARVGGAMHLLDSGVCAPDAAVVSDATNLEIVRAHRGYVSLTLSFQVTAATEEATGLWSVEILGDPAHSAEPALGRNALTLALSAARRVISDGGSVYDLRAEAHGECVPTRARFVCKTHSGSPPAIPRGLITQATSRPSWRIDVALSALTALRPRLTALARWSAPAEEDDFLPTGSLVQLRSASALEGALRLGIEFRPRPGEHFETLTRDIEALTRRLGGDGATVEIERSLLPFSDDPTSPLVDAMREAVGDSGLPTVIGTHRGHTEAWVYQSVEIDTVVFGPGQLSARHRPGEYAVLRQLAAAQAVYTRLIERVCT